MVESQDCVRLTPSLYFHPDVRRARPAQQIAGFATQDVSRSCRWFATCDAGWRQGDNDIGLPGRAGRRAAPPAVQVERQWQQPAGRWLGRTVGLLGSRAVQRNRQQRDHEYQTHDGSIDANG